MFIPGGCFCCEPPEDPCTLSGCTWSSTDMSDTDLTAGTAYHNQISGSTPDGSYEITNAQETGTGNDAPCRKITIETVSAPHKPDTVYAICWKDNATFTPSEQCPFSSVSFCVESKRHSDSDTGLTDSVVFVVRQNGRVFASQSHSIGVNWKRATGTYSLASSFTEIDGTGNPDFTIEGDEIEFGFALKLQVGEDEEPVDIVMFDNLCIKFSCADFSCTCRLNNSTEAVIVFTGLSVVSTGNASCNDPGLADWMTSIFSSPIVVTRPFNAVGCRWEYRAFRGSSRVFVSIDASGFAATGTVRVFADQYGHPNPRIGGPLTQRVSYVMPLARCGTPTATLDFEAVGAASQCTNFSIANGSTAFVDTL